MEKLEIYIYFSWLQIRGGHQENMFSYFSTKTCCGYHKKCLGEGLSMNTYNIYFHGEIRKTPTIFG